MILLLFNPLEVDLIIPEMEYAILRILPNLWTRD